MNETDLNLIDSDIEFDLNVTNYPEDFKKNISSEFLKLGKKTDFALSNLRKLVIHANLMAISLTVELNREEKPEEDYIEISDYLWKLAECTAKTSMQIGILHNYIAMKVDKLKNKNCEKNL